jgi:hypothetical protein
MARKKYKVPKKTTTGMMAGKKGYRDIMNFSDDSKMRSEYFGVIARGQRYFLSRFINVNGGKNILYELTPKEAQKICADFKRNGWTLRFVEKWITGHVV